MVSEIGKYIVSFFFDDKGLQLSLLTFICFVFFRSSVWNSKKFKFLSYNLIFEPLQPN